MLLLHGCLAALPHFTDLPESALDQVRHDGFEGVDAEGLVEDLFRAGLVEVQTVCQPLLTQGIQACACGRQALRGRGIARFIQRIDAAPQ